MISFINNLKVYTIYTDEENVSTKYIDNSFVENRRWLSATVLYLGKASFEITHSQYRWIDDVAIIKFCQTDKVVGVFLFAGVTEDEDTISIHLCQECSYSWEYKSIRFEKYSNKKICEQSYSVDISKYIRDKRKVNKKGKTVLC